MRLSSLLHPQRIKCGLAATYKEGALAELVELVTSTTRNISAQDITTALEEREKQGPFSMGKGSAFPHARTEKIDEFIIALGTLNEGVDFKAPDGVPIRIMVLFVIPKKHSNLYLHTLAAFLSLFQVEEHLDRVLRAKTGEEVVRIIDELGPTPENPRENVLPYHPIIPVQLDTPLSIANERLMRSGMEALPVVDTIGDLLAEIPAAALRKTAGQPELKPTTPLSGFPDILIRTGLSTVQEDSSPQEAARHLHDSGINYAYVLRGRRLLGRITVPDLPKP
jgi:mannitol/fructose-specific phosphotransferase system IIA component (Ntr-type)